MLNRRPWGTVSMKRRQFLQTGVLAAAGVAGISPLFAAPIAKGDSTPKFRLGLVTYNLAASWDLAMLLRACKSAGISPVELRTTHKHGVEPSLNKEQRKDIRKRFSDAGIDIWGCGTTCEFHSPNSSVVKRNIETCKQFVALVGDLGGRGVKVRPNGLPKDRQGAAFLRPGGR